MPHIMSATAEVMIMVTDFNDRNPAFERSKYQAEVYENLTMVCYTTIICMLHYYHSMLHYCQGTYVTLLS